MNVNIAKRYLASKYGGERGVPPGEPGTRRGHSFWGLALSCMLIHFIVEIAACLLNNNWMFGSSILFIL